MKAIIFNSGYGNRMGDFTQTHHKSQAMLKNGDTILSRQLRLLRKAGVMDVIITTGPFEEQLRATAALFPDMRFTFVPNPIFDRTNYIYSMHLAREYLNDDMIFLHGDLVFSETLVEDVLACPVPDCATVNFTKPQPPKDFKGRVKDGKVLEVSVKIFDEDCYAFQPFYKLSRATTKLWADRVAEFIARGEDRCYAENAFNELLPSLNLRAFSYENYYVDEIDNLEDYARVTDEIEAFDQKTKAE